ncbi:DUF397 domain-containing protein [Streptomyces sp. NPDC091280]|uniref:DUF397 domain-containing protein n=1 Tax=Streptomyces sp. NPDC091280 TaxID=3365984 RepID=UPI00382DC0F6
MAPVNAQWRKSSYSGSNGGECVEIAEFAPRIAIRDSKAAPGGAVLTISRRSFSVFVNSLSM